MFDRITITCRGGKGGDGCVSFRKEKFIPRGGPDGGDGGMGGNVVLKADAAVNDFSGVSRMPVITAGNGQPGQGKKKSGRRGEDCIITVPIGTIVGSTVFDGVMASLDNEGDELILAKGGGGGRGNSRFASSVNQVPYEYDEGYEGEEIKVILDLKMIADVGLMGFPNAGKSTLLSTLTGANPKIASYPFTTLDPKTGTLLFSDYEEAIVADIPGLIENASQGAGLGNRFLKHIERTSLLVHVIACGEEDGTPFERYTKLRQELISFGGGIPDKQEIIVLNKTDLYPEWQRYQDEFTAAGLTALPVSALDGTGLNPLKQALRIGLENEPGWKGARRFSKVQH